MKKFLISINVFILGVMLYINADNVWAGPNVTQEKKLQTQTKILVLFQSEKGGTYKLAKAIAEGVEMVPNVQAVLRQIPTKEKFITSIPDAHPEELNNYDGIALGSPVYFGGSPPELRQFLNGTLELWKSRSLEGKPATVFVSSGNGAGSELAIISLWGALAAQGMIIVPRGTMGAFDIDKKIPHSASPYGTVSLTGMPPSTRQVEDEAHLAKLQGQALANTARAIQLFRLMGK